jgi:hypothetical protein
MDTRTKTERPRWTPKARVYHYAVDNVINKAKDNTLDFGSGKARFWENKLGRKHYNIDSFDLSLTDRTLHPYYTVVLVSNVLNVQETVSQLEDTLADIMSFAKSGTRIVWNYPSPRKMDMGIMEIEDYLTAAGQDEGFTILTDCLKGEHAGLFVTTVI